MFVTLSKIILQACRFQVQRALNYGEPGLFAAKSLPATNKYATPKQRKMIQDIGHKYGCHTCGAGSWLYNLLHRLLRGEPKTFKFCANRLPSNSMMKKLEHDGTDTKQQLYPQCPECSKKHTAFCKQIVPRK